VALAGVVFVARSAVRAADAPTTAPAPAPAPAPAGDNSYATDFTKALGDWKIEKAEGKQVDGEGVKLTDLKKLGGLLQEGKKGPDITATPVVLIEVENNGTDEIHLMVKVKSDTTHTKTFEKLPAVAKGKSTIKVNLKDSGIDLTKLTYMRIFGNGECTLTIKSVSFAKE
jgi:hypothetical protein